jgi:hypothetical protein
LPFSQSLLQPMECGLRIRVTVTSWRCQAEDSDPQRGGQSQQRVSPASSSSPFVMFPSIPLSVALAAAGGTLAFSLFSLRVSTFQQHIHTHTQKKYYFSRHNNSKKYFLSVLFAETRSQFSRKAYSHERSEHRSRLCSRHGAGTQRSCVDDN